jgi:hypothetical protein
MTAAVTSTSQACLTWTLPAATALDLDSVGAVVVEVATPPVGMVVGTGGQLCYVISRDEQMSRLPDQALINGEDEEAREMKTWFHT